MLLRNRILDHWYEFRPTLVRDLERSGELAAVTALLDRLLHHAHVLKCGPRSWRTKVQTSLREHDPMK